VKTITNDITKLKDGDYVLRVHYHSWDTGYKELLEKWYRVAGGTIIEISGPGEEVPTTVEVKFNKGYVADALTQEKIDVITPDTFFIGKLYFIVTAPEGTKFEIRDYVKSGSKKYYDPTKKTFTCTFNHVNYERTFGATVWEGGEVQYYLGITSDTVIEVGQEVWYQGQKIAEGSVQANFAMYPPVEPDIIIDRVLVMDAETLTPVSEIASDRNYYFQVELRAKGSPGVEYKIKFYVPTPRGYFTLMDATWTFKDYKKDYDTYRHN